MSVSYEILIAGVSKTIQPGWSISATANGRNVLKCSVISLDGSYRPQLDDDVIFSEGVSIVSSSVANPSIITTLEPHGLVDQQYVTISGHTSTPSLNKLHTATVLSSTTFSVPINVTVGGSGGIAARRIFGGTITLPSEAGLGGLGVVPIETTINATDYNAIADHRFINTVLTGISPASRAYGFLGISTNFANNDQIVLGTHTYVMQTSLTNVDGHVKIGTTINSSLDNLAAAINLSDGSGTLYAASTTLNADASATVRSNGLTAIATVAGTSGNSIPFTTTHGTCFGEGGIDLSTLERGVNTTGTANTVKAALATIVGYLAADGITLDPNQVDGPVLPSLPYDYAKLSDVLDQISVLSNGYIWEFDEYNHLKMFPPIDVDATFDLIDGDKNAEGDITVEPTRSSYANRIILRFSNSAVRSWGFLRAWTNFPDGAVIVLGSTTYTFKTTLTDVAGYVQIGASFEDSILNLIAAITLDGTPGVQFATKTTVNASASAYSFYPGIIKVFAITAGAAGNSIACTTSWEDSSWYWEGSQLITTLAGGQDQTLSNVSIANNTAEQARHGLWEKIIESPDTIDSTVAATTAAAYLATSILVPRTVKYQTKRLGICPGQSQTIQIASRNIDGVFLITDVITNHMMGDYILRSITAVESLILQSVERWRDKYKQWSGSTSGSGSTISVNIGGGGGGSPVANVIYSFGGSDTEWVQDPTPTWKSANSRQITIDTAVRGFVIGTVHVRLRSAAGSVTARLWNVTDGVAVGTGVAITSTSFVTTTFGISLTAGSKTYEIQLLPSVANTDVQMGSGYME
jgi:hypothetical protein